MPSPIRTKIRQINGKKYLFTLHRFGNGESYWDWQETKTNRGGWAKTLHFAIYAASCAAFRISRNRD